MGKKRGPGRPPGKSGVNKAATIRDYHKQHRGAKPAEIATALNEEHGMGLDATYVSNVLSNAKKKRKRGRPRTATKAPRQSSGTSQTFSRQTLLNAKRLVKEMGSVANAKAALELFSELQD